MSQWNSWRRGIRPADLTWMPEEVELAPDWVREEILTDPMDLKSWLDAQEPVTGNRPPLKPRPRRGRPPKKR